MHDEQPHGHRPRERAQTGSRALASLVLAVGLALCVQDRPQAAEAGTEDIIGPFFAGGVAGHRGDASVAADFLVDLAGRVPPSPDVLEPAMMAAISAGRVGQALPLAQMLEDLEPGGDETATLLLLADAARNADWETASRETAALPERDFSATRRRMLGAWTALPLRGVDVALEVLAPMAEQRGLASLHDLHRAALLDVADDPRAAEAYTAALEAHRPPSGRVLLLASNYLARHGKPEEAQALLREQLAAGRGNATLTAVLEELRDGKAQEPMIGTAAEGISEVFLQIGSALAEERPGEQALREARLALYAAPANRSAKLLLGEVLSRLGRHAEAVAAYDALLDDPRYGTVAALARADALAAGERVEDALAAYDRIAAQRPDDPEPVMRRGNLLRWERRFEESVEAYDQTVARLGSDIHNSDWPLFYFRGISNERVGNWDEAEADFRKALELNPEQPQVLNYLGYSWVEQKRNLGEALSMLERAVEQRPRDGYIVDSLGWAFYRLGRFEEAVEQLERAVELEPGQAVINDHLGDAYWRVGRLREARTQWRRTLSLGEDPDVDAETVRLKLVDGLPPLQTVRSAD